MIDRARFGKYRLYRRIGVGGMAEVFEAEIGGTQGLGKRVALKVLLPQFQRDAEVVKSFVDEANIAAALSHPNIVPIFDFGRVDGMYFLAMEYQDGWDLREVLRRCRTARRALPVPAVAYVGHELARALHHIHTDEREVVHRDVTPHNVFLNRDGCVKLGDFGVAKAVARLTHTEQGQVKGKLAYLAPEQASGDPVSCRTDVYAVGLILYEMLTGERFNDGALDADLFANALNPRPRRPSVKRAEAAPLDALVGAALQKHPAMRIRDADLLAEQLAGYLAKHPCDNAGLAGFINELDVAVRSEQSHPGNGALAEIFPVGRVTTKPTQPSGTRRLAESLVRRWPLGLWSTIVAVIVVAAIVVAWAMWPRRSADGVRSDQRIDAATSPAARAVRDAAPTERALPDAHPPAEDVRAPAAESTADAEAIVPARAPRRAVKRRSGRRRPAVKTTSPRKPGKTSSGGARPASGVAAAARPTGTEGDPRAPSAAPSPPDRAVLRRRLEQAAAAARRRGLWPGDSALYDQWVARARGAVEGRGDAEAALRQLEELVDGFRIDQSFIRRKLARLERAIARAQVGEEERGRLTLASQRILRLVLAEQLVAASNQISRLLGRLR